MAIAIGLCPSSTAIRPRVVGVEDPFKETCTTTKLREFFVLILRLKGKSVRSPQVGNGQGLLGHLKMRWPTLTVVDEKPAFLIIYVIFPMHGLCVGPSRTWFHVRN